MLSYEKGIGEYKDWILCEEKPDLRHQGKCESIMALGNGYLGLRSAYEESYVGQVRNLFVAGTFNKSTPGEVTELPNAADVTEMQIFLNGEQFTMNTGAVVSYARCLNLKDGELTREVIWQSTAKETYRLLFRRFVSIEDLHTIAFKVTIEPLTGDARIRVKTGISCRMTNSGSQHFREGDKQVYDKRFMQLVQITTESGIDFVTGCSCSMASGGSLIHEAEEFGVERRKIFGIYSLDAEKNQGVTFEKIVNIFTSRDQEERDNYSLKKLKAKALAHLKNISLQNYDTLLDRSKKEWKAYWEAVEISIESQNSEDLLTLRFAQYHLLIMTPRHDRRFSIGAKALSGEGYKGHVFWDTEIFMLPYFQYSMPQVARQLLMYRYENLEGARSKAAKYGYQGAMYPWETAFTGEEETPDWAALNILTGKPTRVWSGEKEHHITADIAYSLWQYYLSTDDFAFMRDYGSELLFECAWFWCSRLQWNRQLERYEIRDVIGPDEYTEHIDNNAYTNYMAHYVIEAAVRLYELLQSEHAGLFEALDAKLKLQERYDVYRKALEKLYLPTPDADGVIPQDDTFLNKKEIDIAEYRESALKQSILLDYSRNQIVDLQVLKQADVVMLFYTLKRLFDRQTIEAGWKYYEPRTIHDSSLSSAIHSIVAAYFGDTADAYRFFKEACRVDMGQNPISSNTGIHAASMGGIWMMTVFGFGGVYNNEGSLELNPQLPEAWSRLSFSFYWKSKKIMVRVTRDEIFIASDSCEEIPMKVHGRDYALKGRLILKQREVSPIEEADLSTGCDQASLRDII